MAMKMSTTGSSSGPSPRSPTSDSSAPLASNRMIFWVILLVSVALYSRELKSYNAQFIPSFLESVDTFSTAPSTLVSWATESTLAEDGDKNTNKTISKSDQPAAETATETAGSDGDKKANKTISKSSEPPTTGEEIKNPPVSNHTNATSPADEDSIKFKRYDKVAIVTKIHGPHQWALLEQSMCLLHFAYNHKVLYDIVVFTAERVPEEKIEALRKVVAPAKFSIVKDNIGFQKEIAALTPEKRELFLERCQVKSPENLTWWSNCREPGVTKGDGGRVAYNWQAEFRSVRIWTHPALEQYKYMLWLDSDGFASRPWKKDPVEFFIENKGVIMFDNFPQGMAGGHTPAIVKAFNATPCDLKLNSTAGHLTSNVITPEEYESHKRGNRTVKCKASVVPMIHGFFHITDLDFYRQPKVQNGLNALLGNCFLCRSPDDQLAVTIAPAIYAPEKSFDMRSNGFNLGVFHNFHLDGKEKVKPPGFIKWWDQVAKHGFPSADGVCKIVARD